MTHLRERLGRSGVTFACAAMLLAGAARVHAQGTAGAAPPAPAPPPPATTTTAASAPAPTPPAVGTSACVPNCRDGYTCIEGTCVEACNPPCAAGSHCTGVGECIPDALPPPPSYATAPMYPEAPPEELPIEMPDPGAERHDGFLLRLTIGFGGGFATAEAAGSKIEYASPGVSFSVDVGGAPSEDLSIHARLADFQIVDPSVSIDGMSAGTARDLVLGAFLFGPGLTYYVMPANFYLTGAIGLSYLTVDDGSDSASSDVGLGLNFDLGKEWWVSDNWGLGIAGRFWFTGLTDKSAGTDEDWTFLAFGILFSATYQ